MSEAFISLSCLKALPKHTKCLKVQHCCLIYSYRISVSCLFTFCLLMLILCLYYLLLFLLCLLTSMKRSCSLTPSVLFPPFSFIHPPATSPLHQAPAFLRSFAIIATFPPSTRCPQTLPPVPVTWLPQPVCLFLILQSLSIYTSPISQVTCQSRAFAF